MASAPLASPGTEYGPCKDECGHRDCAETRSMAAGECRYCAEPIGYDRHIYRDDYQEGRFVHAACLEDATEVTHK